MKKAGKKVKKDAGKKKQPREKASKHAALVSPKEPVPAAREDTESSDERSADSSATILTSGNPREPEKAIMNTPSTSTNSAAAIEAGVEGARRKELLLCARCHRKLHGKQRRIRSPSVDIRQAQVERSYSNSKVWFYPAAAIILSIGVISGVYMMIGTGIADSSEQRDDEERVVFPQFLCPCNTSYSTSTTGRASSNHRVQSDVIHRRRRFTTATAPLRSKRRELSRGTLATVRDVAEPDGEDTGVLDEAQNKPKKRKTSRHGVPGTGHKGSLTSEKKLPGTTTRGPVGHKIVPARRRAGTKKTLAARLRKLKTLGISGKTTSRSGRKRFRSTLKSSPIPRWREDEEGTAEAPFSETETTIYAAAAWDDSEPSQSATLDDPVEAVQEVGVAD